MLDLWVIEFKIFVNRYQKQIQDGYLAMKYLQNVTLGDKRIIVVNSKIMGAVLRKPPDDSGPWFVLCLFWHRDCV